MSRGMLRRDISRRFIIIIIIIITGNQSKERRRTITIWYDTRCYFNVRSKADTSQLDRTEPTTKTCKTEKTRNGYAQK